MDKGTAMQNLEENVSERQRYIDDMNAWERSEGSLKCARLEYCFGGICSAYVSVFGLINIYEAPLTCLSLSIVSGVATYIAGSLIWRSKRILTNIDERIAHLQDRLGYLHENHRNG